MILYCMLHNTHIKIKWFKMELTHIIQSFEIRLQDPMLFRDAIFKIEPLCGRLWCAALGLVCDDIYICIYVYIYIFVINLLWVNILMNIYTWYIGVDWWYLCFIYICIYIYRVVWCFLGVFECWRSMFICLEMDLLTKEHMRKSGRAPHNNLVQLQSYFLPRVFFYS